MAFNSAFQIATKSLLSQKPLNTLKLKSDPLKAENGKPLNGFKSFDLEDQFRAACDAIQNLPKNGPYQPSNEMLLKFYGYFKQATSGPCQTGRPSMFNVVERAKWDAWHSVRALSKTEAMQGYVDQIKNIIETMPQDKYVQKLTEILEPYEQVFEAPDVNGKTDSDMSISRSDSESEIIPSPNIKNTRLKAMNGEFLLRLPQAGSSNWNQWSSGITNFDKENSQKIWNGNSATESSPPTSSEDKNNGGFGSEDDEDEENYCDTSDSLTDQYCIKSTINPVAESADKEVELANENNHQQTEMYESSNNLPVEFESILRRCGGEVLNPHSSIPSNTHSQSQPSHNNNFQRQSRPESSLSMGYNANRSGAGGSGGGCPPNENYSLSSLGHDTNRQILLILLRLQQDTNNVITRLSYLEATVLSLQSNLQMSRIENSIQLSSNNSKPSAFSHLNSNSVAVSSTSNISLLLSFIKSIDWKTVAIGFLWPFIIRLAIYIMRKIKLVIQIKRSSRI